ncbi:MAG TPA: type II secretion system F family protein [Chthonomonas sp.]|uniref:type II secretion system F family protein n=1 Tax=Chthonomonas sp. TaxID=2282153 RepID=UPI002B4B88A4|nr:type II secretion system F family protein [Chthonomonas sp.]HLI49228.1 type II secretion system F family protein [Chthonomonas sp.]
MPIFQYTVSDATGNVRTGTSEAESEEILTRRLQEQGFRVTTIKKTGKARGTTSGTGFGRVKLRDVAIFCRQFSTMIDAGVSLVRTLDVLGEQTQNPKLRRIIKEIQVEVEGGSTLSKAMAKYPAVFNNLFIGLIRAGEVGGVLEESLQRLAHFLEKDMELRRKVKSALTYPTIVVIVAVLIVLGLTTFIVPKFIDLFKDLGVKELPWMTQVLVDFSNFLKSECYIGLLIIFLVWFSIKMLGRTRPGRRFIDRFKISWIPVFSKLIHKVTLARFARTLSTLLSAGVPILQAMETVAGAVGNVIVSDAIMAARARIREGERIKDPLEKSRLFPPMVVHMISIGEESGSLDHMLTKVADFYEGEVDAQLQSLTAAIEPIMIVFLGFCVGFIVIALFMPLIQVVSNLSGGGGGGGAGAGEE